MRFLALLFLSGCSVVYGMADANLISQVRDETRKSHCEDIRITSKVNLRVYNVDVCGEQRQYIYVAKDGEFVRVNSKAF